MLLEELFTDVADSLRGWQGTEDKIAAEDFAAQIEQLPVLDTEDATATSGSILKGETAYVDGEKVEGTMENLGTLTYSPNDNAQTIPAGYVAGGTVKAADITVLNEYQTCLALANSIDTPVDYNVIDTTAADIREGKLVYINGEKVIGTMTEGIDTSDATASSSDILADKTAYIDGQKVTGTIPTIEQYDIPTLKENESQLTEVNSYIKNINLPSIKDIATTTIKGPELSEVSYFGTLSSSANTDTATLSVNSVVGGRVIAAVMTRTTVVTPIEGWTLLETIDVQQAFSPTDTDYQTITIYHKIADSETTSIAATQSETNQFFITLMSFEESNDLEVLFTKAYPYDVGKQAIVDQNLSIGDIIFTSWVYTGGVVLNNVSSTRYALTENAFKNSRLVGYIINEDVSSGIATLDYTSTNSGQSFNIIGIRFKKELNPDIVKYGETLLGIEGTYTSDGNITAQDISKDKIAYSQGKKIIGTHECLDTSDATAIPSDLLQNKTAYVNGEKITGTLASLEGEIVVNTDDVKLLTTDDTYLTMSGNVMTSGIITEDNVIQVQATNEQVASAIGLAPDLIRAGVNVMGIEGTYDSNPEDYNAKFETPEGITSGLSALKMLVSIQSIDTSEVTDASNIFSGCVSLKSLPDMNLDKATSTYRMCSSCSNLVYVPNLNLQASLNTANMFYGCKNITSFPNFNPIVSQDTSAMFYGCSNLLYINNLNTQSSINAVNMFYNCTNLKEANNVNLRYAASAVNAFANCTNAEYLNITMPKRETSLSGMFMDCHSLKVLPSFNYYYLRNTSGYFGGLSNFCMNCYNLTEVNMGGSYVVARYSGSFDNAFYGCNNLLKFSGINGFTGHNGYEWGYRNMFRDCTNLMYVNNFHLHAPITNYMFANCYNLIGFNNCEISYKTYNGGYYQGTFENCYKLIELDNIVTDIALNYGSIENIFRNCQSLQFTKPVVFNCCNSSYTNQSHNIFTDCHNMVNIDIQGLNKFNNISHAAHNWFVNCYNLETVSINSLPVYWYTPFINCHKLQTVDFINASYRYSNLFRLSGVSSVANSVLVNGVKPEVIDIYQWLYADCYNLTEIGTTNLHMNQASNAFINCYNLRNFEGAVLYNAYNLSNTFRDCHSMVEMNYIANWATGLGSHSISNTFANCINLEYVQCLDLTNYGGKKDYLCPFGYYNAILNNTLLPLNNLVFFGGLGAIGANYINVNSANNAWASIDIVGAPQLSYNSILNITTNVANLYNVYNIEEGGELMYPQLIRMANTQYEKLTEDDIGILTSKGWNISVHNIGG